MPTFAELESRFGPAAYQYLQEIEKAARVMPRSMLDPEIRLRLACQAQDQQSAFTVSGETL